MKIPIQSTFYLHVLLIFEFTFAITGTLILKIQEWNNINIGLSHRSLPHPFIHQFKLFEVGKTDISNMFL